MCSICLWCTRKAALGCELWVAWRRKPSPQVLQDVEGKTAHQSDDSDFPQERQSSNEVNICKKRKTQRQQKRNMFREEAQRGSATWQCFSNSLTSPTHRISKLTRSLVPHFSASFTNAWPVPVGFQQGMKLIAGKCTCIAHLKHGYPSPGNAELSLNGLLVCWLWDLASVTWP